MLIIEGPSGQSKGTTTRALRKHAPIKRAGRWSSHPSAPTAKAWRLGSAFPGQIAYGCPRCGGPHHDEGLQATGCDTARRSKCPRLFGRPGWVNLDVQNGHPPLSVERALNKRLPLWDLVFAYEALASNISTYRVPATNRRAFTHPGAWVPVRGTLPRALQVLRAVGFKTEARDLRIELGGHLHAAEGRLLGSDDWCLRFGPYIRAKLMVTLRAAWRAGGRP